MIGNMTAPTDKQRERAREIRGGTIDERRIARRTQGEAMTDDLRESVAKALCAFPWGEIPKGARDDYRREASAAIRAVLTHYAENGGTISMCQAALEDSRAQPERYLPTGKELWAAERTMQAMMRAALAEGEK